MGNSTQNRQTRNSLGWVALGMTALIMASAAGAQDAAAVDPDHYTVAVENDQVRVLRIQYGPGEEGVMHSHPAGVVVFVSDIDAELTRPDGQTEPLQAAAGDVVWVEPDTHQGNNTSDQSLHVIQIEMKSQDTAADEATIRPISAAWAAAHNAGNADVIADLYWDDAVLQPPGAGMVEGREAIHAFLVADIAEYADFTLHIGDPDAVQVSGNLAFDAGTWSATDASGATVDTGKWIGVYERRDGEWRYIRDTWNSDSAPADGE